MVIKNRNIVFMATSDQSVNLFLYPQIKKLANEGYSISLFCGPGKIDDRVLKIINNYEVIRKLKRNPSLINDFVALVKIIKLLKPLKPDVLIYATPKAAFLGSIAANLLNIKIRIYQIWGVRWQNFYGLKKLLVKSSDWITIKLSSNVVIVSHSVLSLLAKSFNTTKMQVIGFGSTVGINTKIFNYTKPVNTDNSKIVLGYAGRVAKDKGIEDLIEVFEQISEKFPVTLEIIGDLDRSDQIPEYLLQKIAKNSKVFWIRNVNQEILAKHIKNWHAQIFLSKREGLGNVILEAGACGIPTFCWDIIGTRDATPPNYSNFLVEPYNKPEMIKKIESYLLHPFDNIQAQDYSKWFIKNFDQNEVLEAFLKYIRNLGVK